MAVIDYQQFMNDRIQKVKPSGIRRFFDIANEMDHVISLSIGEPDFSTPWHVRQAGIESLEKGRTWYTPNRRRGADSSALLCLLRADGADGPGGAGDH